MLMPLSETVTTRWTVTTHLNDYETLCYKNPEMNKAPGLWKCCMGPLEAGLILRRCTVEPMLDPPGEPCSGHSFEENI